MTTELATPEVEKDTREGRAHAQIMASELGYDLDELVKSESACEELFKEGRKGVLRSWKAMGVSCFASREGGRPAPAWAHPAIEPLLVCIAEGSTLPDVVTTFMDDISLMKKIARYPVVEQYKLVNQGPVETAVVQDDGSLDKRVYRLSDFAKGGDAAPLAGQVFGRGKVNTIQEQERTIEAKRTATPPVKRTYVAGIPTVDKRRGGLLMNGAEFLSKGDLINFLGQL